MKHLRKTRFRFPQALALAASAALTEAFLSGCSFGKAVDTKYYLLDYLPTPPKERLDRGTYPFTLRIREPQIAEAYRRTQIVYRQSIHQMQFYAYHLWAVEPERMVGDMLYKHMRAARLFENVTRSVEHFTPDFILSTEVQAIEEYDGEETWFAHLAVEYVLENQATGSAVWRKQYDFRKKVAQQEPIYVVRELSELLESIHDRMVQDLKIVLDEAKVRALTGEFDKGEAGGARDGAEP